MLIAGFAKSETNGTKKTDKEEINDYAFIKTNDRGEELYRKAVGSSGEEIMRKLLITRDGGYLLTGTSKGKASRDKKSEVGSNGFWIVKLKDKDKPDKDKLAIEAFPNPTAQYTNVIIGYEYEKGTCTVFDLGGLPEGIYVIGIRSNVQKDGVKMIKGISKS